MWNKIILEDMLYISEQNINWNKLKNKTILISGANGMLASYMVFTLLYLNDTKHINCRVLGVVRNEEKAKKRFGDFLLRNDFEIIVTDICEFNSIDEKIDYIIHAAGQASPKYYKIDPVGTLDVNVFGTNNLLKIACTNKVESFLFFSSGEVYGEVDKEYISEDDYGYLDPTNVRSCYAESKRLGENMCVAWAKQYEVPCKIVRPFHTYGNGFLFDDGRVFSDFVDDIVNHRNILVKSDGSANRAFCYIADAVVAYFIVLLEGKVGEAYNIGNDKCSITIKELAYKLCNMFSDRNIQVVIKSNYDNKNYMKSPNKNGTPNIKKAKSLGWIPNIDIEEGFYRTVLSYEE